MERGEQKDVGLLQFIKFVGVYHLLWPGIIYLTNVAIEVLCD